MSIPIQAILNSPSTRSDTPVSNTSASAASSPVSEVNGTFPSSRTMPSRNKRARDTSDLSYTKPTGTIKYGAYENKDDETSMQLMEPFKVYPFGTIQQWSANIPYSSDKKDLKSKTGREKLEVFVYRFTDPKDDQNYDVMWDFRGGYVRISPFFKNARHKKTGPAKMLDANPGMRDVTTQITGGNRIAQGYWVHMLCARAVCATFCYNIRGALIPIFGPDFPNDCIRPDEHGFNCMAIDPSIIREAEIEVKAYRITGRPLAAITSHPQRHVEDQYAGSPMEHRALQRQAEAQYHYSQHTSYGPSPPHYPTPGPTYQMERDYLGPRVTPERGFYKEPTDWISPPASGLTSTRPPSSSSDFCGPYQSVKDVPLHYSLLQSPAKEVNQMFSQPHEPFTRVEKRRRLSRSPEVKRRRMTERSEHPTGKGAPFSIYNEDMCALAPEPIDPNLEKYTERTIVNDPETPTNCSHSSTPETPGFEARDYEGAAIMMVLAHTPSMT